MADTLQDQYLREREREIVGLRITLGVALFGIGVLGGILGLDLVHVRELSQAREEAYELAGLCLTQEHARVDSLQSELNSLIGRAHSDVGQTSHASLSEAR